MWGCGTPSGGWGAGPCVAKHAAGARQGFVVARKDGNPSIELLFFPHHLCYSDLMKADNQSISHPAASVEILVIGGGVIGSSIAYHLARQGRTVLVVERHEVVVEPAASWASAGGIRLWEQEPPEAPLALAALKR